MYFVYIFSVRFYEIHCRSRYGCKEACFWEAELECDTNKMEGAGRSNYRLWDHVK